MCGGNVLAHVRADLSSFHFSALKAVGYRLLLNTPRSDNLHDDRSNEGRPDVEACEDYACTQ